MPNLASVYHFGEGRESMDSQLGWKRCGSANASGVAAAIFRRSRRRTIGVMVANAASVRKKWGHPVAAAYTGSVSEAPVRFDESGRDWRHDDSELCSRLCRILLIGFLTPIMWRDFRYALRLLSKSP